MVAKESSRVHKVSATYVAPKMRKNNEGALLPADKKSCETVKQQSMEFEASKQNTYYSKLECNAIDLTEFNFDALEIPYIDSHCHTDFIFNKLKSRPGEGLSQWMHRYPRSFPRAFAGIIANFIDPSLFTSSPENTDSDLNWISNELKFHYYIGSTWGCHPHFSQKYAGDNRFWECLEDIFRQKDKFLVVAVGECGIDLFKSESSLDAQKYAFERQIELAFRYDLALVIHCRSGKNGNAEEECIDILKNAIQKYGHRYLRIHRHCYTEDWSNAKVWMEQFPNLVFGFTPAVYSFGPKQLETLRQIPLDRIVLETDAPYFLPKQLANCAPPKISLPGMASATAFKIAEIKKLHIDEVMRAAFLNTRRIYGLDAAYTKLLNN
ncbi:unnamed protein product [Caenorhabditis bovis]|uniref:Uncharacterized protein n=1 Tax=Caenorhabditis bovis TaxID=2654633 RepID=A0A8S1F5G7_9PELO|nr:unnamed protein product [Caenorhabditis bovis]